jgi:rRNA maturation RNase YbeY
LSSKVSVLNRQTRVAVEKEKIKKAAEKILDHLGYKGYELTVVVVDDREITRINRQYFRRNRPTNVISFPMMDPIASSLPAKVLGDVIISADTAKRGAEEVGKKAGEEILFLLIHGILHLAGYDHEGAKKERQEMEAKEKELFLRLANPPRRRSLIP